MNRGGKAALVISCLALAGCAGGPAAFKVRPLADPAAKLLRGGDDIAVARAQLALHDVGLALEAFRKIQRDNPSDPAALAGIADCYAAMGRFDLAELNYEAALALSPHDPTLLLGLADAFDREGKTASAVEARAEANAALTRPEPAAVTHLSARFDAVEPAQPKQQQVPGIGSVTVTLPPARPAETLAAPAEPAALAQGSVEVLASLAEQAPIQRPVPAPSPSPRDSTDDEQLLAVNPAPRLERLSFGEVALVTTGQPIWRRPDVAIALLSAPSAPAPVAVARPNIQILNAARANHLAASARSVLVTRGWRKIAIGTSSVAQDKSVVLYPRSQTALGRRLAAQFGVDARMAEQDSVVLVLGRDAINRIAG